MQGCGIWWSLNYWVYEKSLCRDCDAVFRIVQRDVFGRDVYILISCLNRLPRWSRGDRAIFDAALRHKLSINFNGFGASCCQKTDCFFLGVRNSVWVKFLVTSFSCDPKGLTAVFNFKFVPPTMRGQLFYFEHRSCSWSPMFVIHLSFRWISSKSLQVLLILLLNANKTALLGVKDVFSVTRQ